MWLIYASAAAVCFGLRGILYQWTSQKPIERNLFLLGVYVCGMTISLAANLIFNQPWNHGVYWGIAMGIFSFISNAAIYKGFSVGKASLIAVFTGLPPVVVVAGAYLLWGETLTFIQWVAFIIIVSGILLIRYSNDISLNNLQGIQWAIIALIGFGLTDIASKQSTRWDGETLPTLLVMYTTGSSLFFLSWLNSERLRRRMLAKKHVISVSANAVAAAMATTTATTYTADTATVVVAADTVATAATDITDTATAAAIKQMLPAWHTIRLGLFVGLSNISGMILIMPAFRLGITGLVSAVIAMNVLFILLYARIVLKEPFTRMETSGITLTLCGMVILQVFG